MTKLDLEKTQGFFVCQFEVVVCVLWSKVGKEFDMEKKNKNIWKLKLSYVMICIKLDRYRYIVKIFESFGVCNGATHSREFMYTKSQAWKYRYILTKYLSRKGEPIP